MTKWTSRQRDAIEASGGSLLVSAAAGSGKTSVLVEKVIEMLCRDNPISADKLLVVTFSNDAAAEMKNRMSARLSEKITQNHYDLHLLRQQALLFSAQISTIHSFCLELIKQNFHILGLSPDFSIADQNELEIMRGDCMDSCIEQFYLGDSDGSFSLLVELLSGGRDDKKVADYALKIYEFARSHPFYLEWLDEKLEMYSGNEPAAKTAWGQVIMAFSADGLAYGRKIMIEAIELILSDAALEKGYLEAFRSDLAQIELCLAAVESRDWDEAVRLLARFEFVSLKAVRGAEDIKERAKALRLVSRRIVEELRDEVLSASQLEFEEDIADLRPKIAMLFSLVKAFDKRFTEAKTAKRRVDFSDLEHMALELLVRRNGESCEKTRVSEEIASRYYIVMVDEYQDTSEVQDMIFSCVSRDQRNLFMVGDVKQSIYSFRQAMPEIFLRKKEVFYKYDRKAGQFPASIILDANFRSRKEVVDGVNHLFGMIMSKKIGDMDYTSEEELSCGAVYPDHRDATPEFFILNASDEEEGAESHTEAGWVADRIASMLRDGFKVADGAELRPCRLEDFCILIRSPRGRAEAYVKELAEFGVSAVTERGDGYFSGREISGMVSLLLSLDNPLLDIELVAAMSSVFFDFDNDDLARIRLSSREGSFYLAIKASAARGDKKAEKFLEIFARLRRKAAILSADELIMLIYDETDAISLARAMPRGEDRAANLSLLVEHAARYEAMGYKGLSGFVGFLSKLRERGGGLSYSGGAGNGGEGAVRILSIHRSKGLEFPIVFLCETSRKFNKTDLRERAILHSRLGFACVRRDHALRKQFPTLPMQAIRLEFERELLSEELRLLYVALTRAREKLIITAVSKTDPDKRLEKLRLGYSAGRLPEFAVRSAGCFSDWLMMAISDDTPEWKLKISPITLEKERKTTLSEQAAVPDSDMMRKINAHMKFSYAHAAKINIPTKLAISDVAKGKADPARRFLKRPDFMGGEALSATEKGNAMHKFMQFADYSGSSVDLEGEIERMVSCRFLTSTEAQSLSRKRLVRFFSSSLFARIINSPRMLRELRFTAECGDEIIGEFIEGLSQEDRIVLQGVADCVFFELDGAVIVDYKTDAIKDEAELISRYSKQLDLYRRILGKSLRVQIKECLIYSFAIGKEIRMPLQYSCN